MKLLVTGGAGFIGSNLVRYLLKKSSSELGLEITRVVNLDKLTYAGNRSSLRDLDEDSRHIFVAGDICDADLVGRLLREHQIDAVMHLAAESHVDRSIDNPEDFIQTNFVGTYRLLEAFRHYLAEKGWGPTSAKSLKDGAKHVFLHVSTDEVYGSLGPEESAFSETSSYLPNNPYSASKAGGDHLARAYHRTYGMPIVTTNCANNYGPYQFPEKLLPLMILKTLRGESLPVYGDGQQVRDWLYVEDHCRGLAMAMVGGVFGETYMIGGRCEMRNIDVVHAIIDALRELAPERGLKTAGELITYVEDRPGHDRRYAIDTQRIEREFGWQPRVDFASGLRRTVQWYLSNLDWIDDIESGNYRGERLGTIRLEG